MLMEIGENGTYIRRTKQDYVPHYPQGCSEDVNGIEKDYKVTCGEGLFNLLRNEEDVSIEIHPGLSMSPKDPSEGKNLSFSLTESTVSEGRIVENVLGMHRSRQTLPKECTRNLVKHLDGDSSSHHESDLVAESQSAQSGIIPRIESVGPINVRLTLHRRVWTLISNVSQMIQNSPCLI